MNNKKREEKIKCFCPPLSYGSLNSNKKALDYRNASALCVSESRYEKWQTREKETFLYTFRSSFIADFAIHFLFLKKK